MPCSFIIIVFLPDNNKQRGAALKLHRLYALTNAINQSQDAVDTRLGAVYNGIDHYTIIHEGIRVMKVYIARDQDDWARAAADAVMETVSSRPHPVLVLPTGSTPLPLYEELVRRRRHGVSFAHVTTFNLDEYIGLPQGHPETYHVFMERNLFGRLDIPGGRWHVPNGFAADPERAAAEYDAAIAAAGGVDLAVLGVGHNGHIGFNEPGTPPRSATHVAVLSEDTRAANARFFGGLADVPHRAITMGLGFILGARRILFLAQGADKAEIVRRVFRGPVTTAVPGSLLQQHADVTVILDEEAAARIK